MQDNTPTGTFDALNPPTIDQPTFTPPVFEPPLNTWPAAAEQTPPAWGTVPPPPPGAGQRKSKVGRNLLIGLAVLVGLGMIGAATEKKDESPKFNAVEAGLPSGFSSTPTTSFSASSGSSTGSSLSMAAWAARYGDDADDISNILTSLQNDASSYDVTSMEIHCRRLGTAIATAQSHLPVPVASINAPYSEALRYYSRAADACVDGTSNFDADALQDVVTYLDLGNDALERATDATRLYND